MSADIEQALGWSGPAGLGGHFARGSLTDTALLERMMTPQRLLDMTMRRSLAHPQFRMFRDGEELNPSRYLNPEVSRRGQSVDMVGTSLLGSLLREGATMVLDQSNVFDPTMEVACRALQWWSREHVQANIYLTTNEAAGFKLHWDDHDVVIIQLAGDKEWEVRGTSRPYPMYRDAARNDSPSEEIVWAGTMKKGDVMHIPRGHWHQATRNGSGSGQSLHMTLGFEKRTGVNWLSWLADWSRETEIFRHDLDRWGSAEEQEAQQQQLAEAAITLIGSRSPRDFLAAREQEVVPPRHVPYVEFFGPLTSVVCVTNFPPRILERDDAVEIIAARKKLTFAAKALPALRLLLSGHPAHLDQAASQVGVEVEHVAKILTEEELCAPLTPELSSGYTGLVTSAVN
ncbi:cupin domain-containing protein [Streptomyces sp. NPDC047042]|uniref:JmjC domain-containing protein n=1 Tax=Streptomyces sp. NPDC047042 TaxID=3154807 RepID=UPI00340CB2B1